MRDIGKDPAGSAVSHRSAHRHRLGRCADDHVRAPAHRV